MVDVETHLQLNLVKAAEIGKSLLERNAWLEKELERARERIGERDVRCQELLVEIEVQEKTTRKLKSQLRRHLTPQPATTTSTSHPVSQDQDQTHTLLRRLKTLTTDRTALQATVTDLTSRCEDLEMRLRECGEREKAHGERMRGMREEVKRLRRSGGRERVGGGEEK
ncbi:hypothetical protein HDU67_004330, partial [Dinochytrium kinnereticum]